MKKLNSKFKIIFKKSFYFFVLALFSLAIFPQSVLGVDYYAKCDGLTGDEKKQCEKNAEKAEAYEKLIKLKEKQASSLADQINSINQQQATTQATLAETKKKFQTLAEQVKSLEKDLEERNKNLENKRKILSGLVQSYYDNNTQDSFRFSFLDKTISRVFEGSDRLSQSGDKIMEAMEEINEEKAKMEKEKKELEDKKSEQEEAKENLEKRNLDLQSTENQKQTLLGQTEADKKRYEELLSNIEDEIYNLESGKSADLSNLPPAKGGYFDYPVGSVRITQKYGMTSYAKSGAYGGKAHNGIDFGISYGAIYAAGDGKVIGSGNNGKYAYGQWLAIDHGDGLVTLYGHLSKKSVSKGSKVKKGDKIGTSGNTGYSTGPHLHFSVFSKKSFETVESKYVDGLMIPVGASVNPMRYLD
ncbi:MAG: murein hydrolase activator EnvC family protein [Patescibacteria group bacterium]